MDYETSNSAEAAQLAIGIQTLTAPAVSYACCQERTPPPRPEPLHDLDKRAAKTDGFRLLD